MNVLLSPFAKADIAVLLFIEPAVEPYSMKHFAESEALTVIVIWLDVEFANLALTIFVAATARPTEVLNREARIVPLIRERRDRYSNGLLIDVDTPHYELTQLHQ